MAIYGFQTNNPDAKFGFARSYIHQITFGFGVGASFAQTDNDFIVTDTTNPIVHVKARFNPRFWTWSSNCYTLDFLMLDWWLYVDPSPVPIPLAFSVYYGIDPVTLRPEAFVFIAGWTQRYKFILPPPPPHYWQPDT